MSEIMNSTNTELNQVFGKGHFQPHMWHPSRFTQNKWTPLQSYVTVGKQPLQFVATKYCFSTKA